MPSPAALITGGTSGIGLATAQLLHERGSKVMVTGRNPDGIEKARRELPDDVVFVQADVRSLTDTDRVVAEAKDRFGQLTTLFLNAGVLRSTPLAEIDEATYDDLFAVNTKGQFFTLQRALPVLADGASVIFTVGAGLTRGRPGTSVPAGSRGALLSMLPSLTIELAPRRIRVNAVSPGLTDTPIWAQSGASPDELRAMQESAAAGVPFGRLAAPRDIAETVAFLASERASYITGQNIMVEGGLLSVSFAEPRTN